MNPLSDIYKVIEYRSGIHDCVKCVMYTVHPVFVSSLGGTSGHSDAVNVFFNRYIHFPCSKTPTEYNECEHAYSDGGRDVNASGTIHLNKLTQSFTLSINQSINLPI